MTEATPAAGYNILNSEYNYIHIREHIYSQHHVQEFGVRRSAVCVPGMDKEQKEDIEYEAADMRHVCV